MVSSRPFSLLLTPDSKATPILCIMEAPMLVVSLLYNVQPKSYWSSFIDLKQLLYYKFTYSMGKKFKQDIKRIEIWVFSALWCLGPHLGRLKDWILRLDASIIWRKSFTIRNGCWPLPRSSVGDKGRGRTAGPAAHVGHVILSWSGDLDKLKPPQCRGTPVISSTQETSSVRSSASRGQVDTHSLLLDFLLG